MSALFMSHHRYSTINPEDIARFGGRRVSLNSIAFRSADADEDDEEGAESGDDEVSAISFEAAQDEEQAIGSFSTFSSGRQDSVFKRQASSRRSTRSRLGGKKRTILNRLYRKWKRVYRRYGFNHLIPILLLIAYSFFGALVFRAIEMPHAEHKKNNTIAKLENNRRLASEAIIADLGLPNEPEINDQLLNLLAQFERNNTAPAKETITWDMWGSLFYCGTIYTTVGYGNIHTETTLGWIFTMIYAFFGVPLLLAILNDIGQLLCGWIDQGWLALANRVPKRNNDKADLVKNGDENVDDAAPQVGAPVTVALFLTFAWLLMCSALFCLWEKNWSYLTAFYFFFISLSTIGLGDVVPDEPMLMVLNFGFVIIGLCLVSMTLGVVQEHIELFLYRVMIALQKECESLLANGEDVAKKDLVKKVWDKQPWYVKRFMPAFMGGAGSKRLNDFAGATITDTAVQMGLIPPPPGYRHGAPATTSPCPPPLQPANVRYKAPYSEPVAKFAEASLTAQNQIRHALVDASSTLARSGLPKVATVRPQKRVSPTPSFTEFLPGGRAIIRRVQSTTSADHYKKLDNALRARTAATQTLTESLMISAFVQTDLSGPELLIKKETYSNLSLASWCENDPLPLRRMSSSEFLTTKKNASNVFVQTDLSGKEMMIKMETLSNLSLASWCEDEDQFLPAPMRPMQTFASDDLLQFKEVAAAQMATASSTFPKIAIDVDTQTDPARGPVVEDSFSMSSEEFESARETKSIRVLSKFVQTIEPEGANAETQTAYTNLKDVEIQTSVLPRLDAESQCQPCSNVDQEVQTTPWSPPPRVELSDDGENKSQDTFFELEDLPMTSIVEMPKIEPPAIELLDKCTQTSMDVSTREIEIQTTAVRSRSLEMQTEALIVFNAETQTFVPRRFRLRSSLSEDDENEEDEEGDQVKKDDDGTPINAIWSYNAWFSDDRRKKRLDSVPEEEDEEVTSEESDQEMQEEEFEEQNEESESDIIEEPSSPSSISEGGVDLPGITISPPSSIGSDDAASQESLDNGRHRNFGSVSVEVGVQTDDDGYSSLTSSAKVSVACQTLKFKQPPSKEIITAAIATQTEELLERRGTFPRAAAAQMRRAEAVIGDHHGASFRAKWSNWMDRRKSIQRLRPSHNRRNAAVQTEGYSGDGVRDIIIQTDDSYLRAASRLNALRTMRARSLAIAVSPQVKQRFKQLAAATVTAQQTKTASRHGKK